MSAHIMGERVTAEEMSAARQETLLVYGGGEEPCMTRAALGELLLLFGYMSEKGQPIEKILQVVFLHGVVVGERRSAARSP